MLANMTIKNNIRQVLKDEGWTGYRLAKAWGKHHSWVYALLRRPYIDETDIKTVVDIADIIGISVDRLIGRESK